MHMLPLCVAHCGINVKFSNRSFQMIASYPCAFFAAVFVANNLISTHLIGLYNFC